MTSISDTEVVNAPGGLVELGYSQITTSVTLGTSSGVVISPISVVCDGSPILVEFFAVMTTVGSGAGSYGITQLMVDGSVAGRMTQSYTASAIGEIHFGSSYGSQRLTPSAGVHTFGINGYRSSVASSQINAGNGSGDGYPPAFIRISKILQASQLLVTQSNAPIVTSLPSGNLVTGQEVDLYVTTPYAGYQRYKWNGSAWYVIGDSRAQGVWQSFTPTLTQSSNVTFNVNYAKYVVFGKTVMVNFSLSITSSGVASNTIFLNFGSGSTALPTAANAGGIHGSFRWFDSGVSNWIGTVCGANTTQVFFLNDGNGNNAGFSGTLTNGDVIEGSFFYEMA